MNNRFGNISISDDESEKPIKKSPAPAEHKQPKRKRRKSRGRKPLSRTAKLILWFGILPAVLLGVYSVSGFLLLPKYVEEKTPALLHQDFGIDSSLSAVTFNPFNFAFTITDFAVQDRSEKDTPPLIHIDHITGKLSPLELLRTNLAIKQISISSPAISLIRFNENEYNFSSHFSADQLNNQEDFLNFAELPFLYSINNIAISGGEIQFIDKPSGKNHQVNKLEISIPTLANFDYDTPIFIQSDFSAELNGSPLVINSESNKTGEGLAIDLNEIELPEYAQYLPFDLPIKIHSGKTDGKLLFAFNDDRKLNIEYQLQIANLTGDTTDESLHIEIPSSQVIGSYQPMNGSFFLENVYLKEPFVRTSNNISRSTINSLLPEHNNDSGSTSPALAVHRLLVNGARLEGTFHDNRLSLQNLEFKLHDYQTRVSSTEILNPGTFSLKGSDKDQGQISWQGQFNESDEMTGDFQLKHFSGNDLCKILWHDSLKCSAADTEMKGIFTVSRQKETNQNSNLFLTVSEGSINLERPAITAETAGFKAFQMLAEDVSYDAVQKKIGKLTIKDIEVSVADDKVADLLTPVTSNKNIEIDAFDISGKATITNQHKQPPLVLNKMFLQTKIDTEDKSKHNINFKGYTQADGEIRADGSATLTPLALTLSVSFDDIDTRELFPLLTSNPTAFSSEAKISGKGQYTYPQSGFFGTVESGPVNFIANGKSFGKWKKGQFTSVIYKSNPYSFRIKDTTITEPIFYFDDRKSDKITPDKVAGVITTLLPLKNLPKNPNRYKYPFYQFETIEIKNGKLASIYSPETIVYNQINGKVDNTLFPTEGKESTFVFQARQKGIPLKLAGTGVFLQPSSNGSYTLTVSNPNLESIARSSEDIGLDIEKAEIKGEINTEWFNGKSVYSFDLDAGNIVPLEKDSLAALTLALLYKNSPRFDIAFEYNQNTQVENLPFYQLILDYFKRNQLKTQISPFLLTPEFTDLIDLNHISFRDGSSELTADGIEWLTRLGVFLQNYPLIKLQLIPSLAEKDKVALQQHYENLEATRVAEENEKRYREWQEANLEISRQREELAEQNTEAFIEEDLNAPALQPFTPITPKPVVISAVELNELAYERQKEVAEFLRQSLHVDPAQLEQVNQIIRSEQDINGVKLNFTTRFKTQKAE